MPAPPPGRPSMPLLAALAAVCAVVGVAMIIVSDAPLGGAAFLVAAAGLGVLPSVQQRRARRVASLAGGGRPATARIVSVHPVRARGGVRRVRVHYEITPDGRPPYRLTTRHVLPTGMEDTFVAGNRLRVRVDPADPKNVVLTTDDG